jgi:hypothetical protein
VVDDVKLDHISSVSTAGRTRGLNGLLARRAEPDYRNGPLRVSSY